MCASACVRVRVCECVCACVRVRVCVCAFMFIHQVSDTDNSYLKVSFVFFFTKIISNDSPATNRAWRHKHNDCDGATNLVRFYQSRSYLRGQNCIASSDRPLLGLWPNSHANPKMDVATSPTTSAMSRKLSCSLLDGDLVCIKSFSSIRCFHSSRFRIISRKADQSSSSFLSVKIC